MKKLFNRLPPFFELAAYTMLFVGLVVSALFLSNFELITNRDSALDTELNSRIGDFMGGVVGSMWSLASVLLFYEALRLQRKEFKELSKDLQSQRREFYINKATEIVFHQLAKIDSIISNSSFSVYEDLSPAKKLKDLEGHVGLGQIIYFYKEVDLEVKLPPAYEDHLNELGFGLVKKNFDSVSVIAHAILDSARLINGVKKQIGIDGESIEFVGKIFSDNIHLPISLLQYFNNYIAIVKKSPEFMAKYGSKFYQFQILVSNVDSNLNEGKNFEGRFF